MRRRRPNGTSGIVRQARHIDTGTVPSTRSRAAILRSTGGHSAKSLVARQAYWSLRNQATAEDADQTRQQTEAAVGHVDIEANWDGSPTALGTASLDNAPDVGSSGGTVLLGGQAIPEGYLPPIQPPQ